MAHHVQERLCCLLGREPQSKGYRATKPFGLRLSLIILSVRLILVCPIDTSTVPLECFKSADVKGKLG
jgi:hypothetical protein